MEEGYRSLEVTCPVCQVAKNINVPEVILAQKKFGSIKVQIPRGAVCPDHFFIAFVDPEGFIRGYERIDVYMGAPTREAEDPGRLTLQKFIQMFGLYGVFSLIHAKIFNYPSYIIKDKNAKDISVIMNKIGDGLLPEKYQGTSSLKFLEETNYNKINLKEKNALLMDSQLNILQTPWEEKLKLKFEESIVNKALDIIDEEEQIILLQQDITKFIEEAEYTKDILENVKEIYEDDLMEQISKDLNVPKIDFYRLTLIKDFIKQRYSPKLISRIKNKVEEFLNLL